MLIIGCDYHPSFQQIAGIDTDTGELSERHLAHREQAEQFYRELKQRSLSCDPAGVFPTSTRPNCSAGSESATSEQGRNHEFASASVAACTNVGCEHRSPGQQDRKADHRCCRDYAGGQVQLHSRESQDSGERLQRCAYVCWRDQACRGGQLFRLVESHRRQTGGRIIQRRPRAGQFDRKSRDHSVPERFVRAGSQGSGNIDAGKHATECRRIDAHQHGDVLCRGGVQPLRTDGGVSQDEWNRAAGQPGKVRLIAIPGIANRIPSKLRKFLVCQLSSQSAGAATVVKASHLLDLCTFGNLRHCKLLVSKRKVISEITLTHAESLSHLHSRPPK